MRENRRIILHGHFYQPPREDPWTGFIENQPTAAPFKNWNERITAECYAACAYSRVLNPDGSILAIRNNYSHLSFNFGPTLLSWLEESAPNVYRRILEADRESLDRLGYGNAIAQGYNHTILPLARPEDARVQIRWGLEDFSRRFSRKADGMWLPECGVSHHIFDILIEEDVKFVVLSPWQGRSVETEPGNWVTLENTPAPSDRPFLVERPEGSIVVFFYHPDLASGISFNHLLQNRDTLKEALYDALEASETGMVSIATDGEIYGHHEPFGDMCISSLIENLNEQDKSLFTNYAAYLAENPPHLRALIHEGDDELGSSWSCSHGVGRWMRDCGCSTGGEEHWNQSWRSPLRAAFDGLRDRADSLWKNRVEALTKQNPQSLLHSYIRVVSGAQTPEDFAKEVLTGNSDAENHEELLRMLEGARYLQFMYTSCGWFFSDLSGLEPLQNIRYAAYAAELIDPDENGELMRCFSKLLSRAKSNIERVGTGSDVLQKNALPLISPSVETAAIFFWKHLYELIEKNESWPGKWKETEFSLKKKKKSDDSHILTGHIRLQNVSTLQPCQFSLKAETNADMVCTEVALTNENNQEDTISIQSMPASLKHEIQVALLSRSERHLMSILGAHAPNHLRDQKIINSLELPFSAPRWKSFELSLYYGSVLLLKNMKKAPLSDWPRHLPDLEQYLSQRKISRIGSGKKELEGEMSKLVSHAVEKIIRSYNQSSLLVLVDFIKMIQRYELQPFKSHTQNKIYDLLEEAHKLSKKTIGRVETDMREGLSELAKLLGLNPKRFV